MEKETEKDGFDEMIEKYTPIGIDLAKKESCCEILRIGGAIPRNIIFYAKDGSTMTFNLDNKTNLENIANALQKIMVIPKCKKILQEAGLMSIEVKKGEII